MKKHFLKVLENYQKKFAGDSHVNSFLEYLDKNNNCIDRKNMNGHVTVSGLVVDNNKVLLLFHKVGNRYQQPGGHIDDVDENIFQAAIREVKEETGMDTERVEGIYGRIPISLDIHKIDERIEKEEGEHLHFDMMVLLKLKNPKQKIVEQIEEVGDVKWVDINNEELFSNMNTFKKALEKLDSGIV